MQSRALHSSWTGAVLRLANVDLALLVCSFQHGHNGTRRFNEHDHHAVFFGLGPKSNRRVEGQCRVSSTSRLSQVPVGTRQKAHGDGVRAARSSPRRES